MGVRMVSASVLEPVGAETPLLTDSLGTDPPVPAVYLALLLAWDVIYRIGIGDGVTLTVNEYVSKRSQLRTEGDRITAVVPYSHLMFFDTSDGARIREEA